MTDTPHVNLAHARVEHQRDTMKRITEDGVCPFCREHFERYHTKPIIRETEHWILTENFAPYEGAVQHFLLVPTTHCTFPDELSAEAWSELHTLLKFVREVYVMPGATFVMRFGDTDHTGASVTHLHAQIVCGEDRKKGGKPILTALGYQAPDKPATTSHE